MNWRNRIPRVDVEPDDLLRDDPAQPRAREPVANAKHLPPRRDRVIEEGQEHVDSVEDDPLCPDLVCLRFEDGEHPQEIEVTRLHVVGSEARIEE